jgi:hypothetical protein
MRGHFLRMLKRAAVGEIGSDPGGAERVATDRRADTGRGGGKFSGPGDAGEA